MHALLRSTLSRYVQLSALLLLVGSQACGANPVASEGKLSYPAVTADPLTAYALLGGTHPVHDPSVIQQGKTWYVFSSDSSTTVRDGYLQIRCSNDELSWIACGRVFPQIPAWVRAKVPGVGDLWAPDISYFNGLYHLYYAGSTAGSQRSVIGLATNTTLDPADPAYAWLDRGEVLESSPVNDFNAIDPNLLVDTDGRVWMTYGSYWTGIKQVEVQPSTGLLLTPVVRHDLATRPDVDGDPIEGASLVHHGKYYYLFVSIDFCCSSDLSSDNYKEAVGRSSSPNGPFVAIDGTPMMKGGATVLLSGNGTWNAPGGGTAYVDPSTQASLIVFHALSMPGGAPYLWLKQMAWVNDWPVLVDQAVPGTAASSSSR